MATHDDFLGYGNYEVVAEEPYAGFGDLLVGDVLPVTKPVSEGDVVRTQELNVASIPLQRTAVARPQIVLTPRRGHGTRISLAKKSPAKTRELVLGSAQVPIPTNRVGSLAVVVQNAQAVSLLLGLGVYRTDQLGDPELGSVQVVLGSAGDAVAQIASRAALGNAVLIEKVPGLVVPGVTKLVFTKQPSVVAAMANADTGAFAVYMASPEMLTAANGAPPVGPTGPGAVTSGSTLTWLVGGAVAIGVLVWLSQRKS